MIAGFQPLSLLDYPGHPCSIIFTQGCAFRCVYCHNPQLIPRTPAPNSRLFPADEVLATLQKRRSMVQAVCITGGEPTMQADLTAFITRLKEEGFLVKLDTNGVHPRLIEQLLADRLVDYVAMDIKHTWDRYLEVIDIPQKHVVEACASTFRLLQASEVDHEFRTTVYSALHSEQDLHAIAGQLRPGTRYALQQIRYTLTLKEDLPHSPAFDLPRLAERLQAAYPDLRIEARTP